LILTDEHFMRILLDPKVYLVQRPFLVWEGLNEFLTDNDLLWPTPIEGVPTAQIAIEAAGRLCYMSYGSKSGSKTNAAYLDNLLGRLEDGAFRPGPAHGSVTEHEHYSFIVGGASRGWSHEQVRHRLNNYSQLSTRYCDYELQDTKPGDWEPAYVIPPLGQLSDRTKELFAEAYEQEREFYVKILHSIEEDLHAKPEFQAQLAKLPPRERSRALRKAARGAAREVLPNGTEALMFMTGNARTIWNEAYLRASGEAEAVIRSVYVQILRIMERQLPDLYKGIQYIKVWDGSEAAVLPKEKL
jgi:flavin-dependent thymidylate synthase